MNKKLNTLLQLHKQYVVEQDKIMHSINTLLRISDEEPDIYEKIDSGINDLVVLHAKMREVESFIIQLRGGELESDVENNAEAENVKTTKIVEKGVKTKKDKKK